MQRLRSARCVGLFTAIVLAAACAGRTVRPGPGPDHIETGSVCGVVAAALDSLVPTRGRAGARLAVRAATRPARIPSYADAVRDVPGLDSATWTAFVHANRAPGAPCTTLPDGRSVAVVPDSVLRALPTGDAEAYWRAFRLRYPGAGGLTTLSGLGIGAGGRQALLVLDHGCGGLCGWGYVVLLERASDGSWRVRRAHMTWVS